MWTDPEEARSDFILAAATALFGPLLFQLLLSTGVPIQRLPGMLSGLLTAALIFVFTGLVPVLLARYRGEGAAAFGFDGPRSGIAPGFLVALPVVALGVLLTWSRTGQWTTALLGKLSSLFGNPAEIGVTLLGLTALFAGALLLYGFLTVKARDAFRGTEIGQLEVLRTFGMGAVGGAIVAGLVAAATGAVDVLRVVVEALSLVAVILLADRLVEPRVQTTRATVVAPAIVALLLRVELFSGQFFLTLREGLLAAGTIVVFAVLIETRRHAWAVVPVLVALTIYPTALHPFVSF